MKSVTAHYLILGGFCLAFYCGRTSCTFLESEHHPHTWKKLFLVHHWPVTVCKYDFQAVLKMFKTRLLFFFHTDYSIKKNNSYCNMSENDCKDPPQYWTIHGLWPDKAEDCNRTWHFDVNEIKDLLPNMRQYWPDVLHSSPNRTQFWKHEWEKHGTCAATLEPLSSQKKYFGKTLDLYQKLDLSSYLLKVGIKPSSTYYQMTAIKEALTSVYGVTPKIQCLPPEEGEEVQTIGQIEFCFTKEFELRNCTHSKVESYIKQNDWHFRTEELSICNDTLTYYPAQVQFYN